MSEYIEWGCLDGKEVWGTVHKIVDGDSVHIIAPVGEAGGYYLVKCRLAGINTPELKENRSAKTALENIIHASNNLVYCKFGKKEKYGRILVNLYGAVDSSKSINQMMIDNGEAVAYFGGKK